MIDNRSLVKIKMPSIRPSLEYAIHEIINFIDSHQKDGKLRVLEVGCGVKSIIGTALRGSNRHIILHGIDIDDYALKNKEVDKVFIANVEKMPFEDFAYDIVIAQFVLEHIKDYKAALKEMARVVVPNGLLVLTFPNPSSPEAIVTRLTPLSIHIFFRKVISKIEDAERHTFPTTFSFKSCNNVNNILISYGFRNVGITYFAETYFRFRYRRILGNMAILYTRIISLLGLEILKSSAVVIARKCV